MIKRVTPLQAAVLPTAVAGMGGLACAILIVTDIYLACIVALVPSATAVVLGQRLRISSLTTRASIAWIVLLITVLPWNTVTLTSTGLESTGAEAGLPKLILTFVGIALAVLIRPPGLKYRWPFKALVAYAIVAAFGAFVAGDPGPSVVRSVRFILLALATVWIITRLPKSRLILLFVQFAACISIIALVGQTMGLATAGLYDGRLAGYLPPLHPNLLGMLAAGGLLCAVFLIIHRQLKPPAFAVVSLLLGTTLILTQSRTSMAALVVGLLALSWTRLSTRGAAVIGVTTFAVVAAVFIQTNTASHPLSSIVTRSGSTTATGTLESRVSAWDAVVGQDGTVGAMVAGRGLSAKTVYADRGHVPVVPVDGSWPAAYLSGGLIGAALLSAVVLTLLINAIKSRDNFAAMIMAFLITISTVTNVFSDMSVGLMLVLAAGAGVFCFKTTADS